MTARARAGFTLMELMVVIAIVGILAALSIVGIAKSTERARATTATAGVVSSIAEGRNLAAAKNAQVIVIVDQDNSVSNNHAGVYEILDPDRLFVASSFVPDRDPLNANAGMFTNGSGVVNARLLDAFRFADEGLQSHIAFASASDASAFATGAASKLSPNSPWVAPTSGCSFCNPSTRWGYVQFDPSGRTLISNPLDSSFGAIASGVQGAVLLLNTQMGTVDRGIFIATPTGLTNVVVR